MKMEFLAFGLLVSTMGGLVANLFILDWWLWPYYEKKYSEDKGKLNFRTDRLIVRILGFFERALYTISIIMCLPQWIAVWLTLKTAVAWVGWQNDTHRKYNLFLIGNAVSILFGIIGAYCIKGLP